MNSNLMGSPRVQMRTQQVSRSKAGKTHEVRLCLPAVIDDCHALSVSRISRERLFDGEEVIIEMPPDHYCVASFHPPRSDCRAQNSVGSLRLRDDQKSRSFLVQPVNYSRPVGRCSGRKFSTAT